MTPTPNPRVSRLHLERYLAGDLDEDAARSLESAVADDAALARRLERLREDLAAVDDAVPAMVPPWELDDDEDLAGAVDGPASDSLAETLSDPAPANTASWVRWLPAGGVAALAAVAAVLLVVFLVPSPTVDDGTRFRGGGIEVVTHLVHEGEAQTVGALVPVVEGDRLQMDVEADAAGHLHVFDLQDDGALSVWQEARPVAAHEVVTVAAILDDHPGSERVYVVLSETPLTRETVLRHLTNAPAQPLAARETLPGLGDATQRSILLVREP